MGEIKDSGKDKITGLYKVEFSEFKDLIDVWGSVRMAVKGVPPWDFPQIILTRVPFDEYDKHFTCVSTICTHEGGEIYDLDEYHEFECSRHGTLFTVEGEYIVGPASRSLDSWQVFYEPGNDYCEIDLPVIPNHVDDFKFDAYLAENYPNPADEITMIEFGIVNNAKVTIDVFDFKGTFIQNIQDAYFNSGIHKISINTEDYISGIYMISLMVNGKIISSRKMIVRH